VPVYTPAFGGTILDCLLTGADGSENLPKVVTQPRIGRESNPRPGRKSDALPLRHHAILVFLSRDAMLTSDICCHQASMSVSHEPVLYRSVPTKILVLPSGALSQTLDLENVATASLSCCQKHSSTVELVDDTYDGRRIVAVCYMSTTNCHPISYNSITSICSRFVDELFPTITVAAVDEISTDIRCRAVAELLVF